MSSSVNLSILSTKKIKIENLELFLIKQICTYKQSSLYLQAKSIIQMDFLKVKVFKKISKLLKFHTNSEMISFKKVTLPRYKGYSACKRYNKHVIDAWARFAGCVTIWQLIERGMFEAGSRLFAETNQ